MRNEKPTIGCIAIEGKKLAIFGSRSGFAGPVIQDYQPFEDEEAAIKAAKIRIRAMGLPVHDEISRPRITKMTLTYSRPKPRKKK